MIPSLYEPFKHWAKNGSIYILSDMHFNDKDCKLMDENWPDPEEQIDIINKYVNKSDTFICLGDVGNPEHIPKIRAGKKILILGNHDKPADYRNCFTEMYNGPLFISNKILLSHEPIHGLSWCLNIHGHDHNNVEPYIEGCKHLNLAANICNFKPINLGKTIKEGILSDIKDIHRLTIDKAILNKGGDK